MGAFCCMFGREKKIGYRVPASCREQQSVLVMRDKKEPPCRRIRTRWFVCVCGGGGTVIRRPHAVRCMGWSHRSTRCTNENVLTATTTIILLPHPCCRVFLSTSIGRRTRRSTEGILAEVIGTSLNISGAKTAVRLGIGQPGFLTVH